MRAARSQSLIFTKLAEEILDNTIDDSHRIRRHPQCICVNMEDGLAIRRVDV